MGNDKTMFLYFLHLNCVAKLSVFNVNTMSIMKKDNNCEQFYSFCSFYLCSFLVFEYLLKLNSIFKFR